MTATPQVTLALPAQLTYHNAPATLAALRQQLQQQIRKAPNYAGGMVALDASALDKFDTSALAVLLGLRRTAATANWQLHILATPASLQDLQRVYGIDSLLA